MKKLMILTENYPFTRGELPFLEPELRVLRQHFEITILCKSPSREQEYTLQQGIRLIHYCPQPFSLAEKVFGILGCVFSPSYYRELFDHRNPGGSFRKKEADIRGMRLRAGKLYRWMKAQRLFEHAGDTIYYSYWCNDSTLALCWAKKRNPQIKMVSRITGYDLYNERCNGKRQPYKRLMDQYLDKAFFISEVGKKYYETHFSCRKDLPRLVCYLGVSEHGTARMGQDGVFHVFSCSNLISLKRVHLIIEALALLSPQKVQWSHAGGGNLEESLRLLARERLSGTQISYCFLGSVPNQTILDFYQSNPVDCFITTSETEGAPVSIMEAMSFGVPVVATAVGGIPEMVEDGRNGFLLSPNPSPQEVAEGLKMVLELPEEARKAMRKNAREMWKQRFCADLNYTRFSEELKNL